MHDVQDKAWWVKYGAEKEKYFVDSILPKYNIDKTIIINPAKERNSTAADLICDTDKILGDLKICETPFFTAGKYGMDPNGCVTFDEKDYIRYMFDYQILPAITYTKKPQTFFIMFYVSWPEQDDYGVSIKAREGLWAITIRGINNMVLDNDKIKWHRYKNRVENKDGNGRASMIIPLSEMKEYSLR